MRQLAAESLFLLTKQSEETATGLVDRDDFWSIVMGVRRPTLPDSLSPPSSMPKSPHVEEALNEDVPRQPLRNPQRAVQPQKPSLGDMRPGRPEKRAAEAEVLGEPAPKRPRWELPTELPARDETLDEPKPRLYVTMKACPYRKPSLNPRELIEGAILSSPHKQMSVPEMKRYLKSNFPWYTWGAARDKLNCTIRRALRQRNGEMKRFEEVPGQQGYWRVAAEYLKRLRDLVDLE